MLALAGCSDDSGDSEGSPSNSNAEHDAGDSSQGDGHGDDADSSGGSGDDAGATQGNVTITVDGTPLEGEWDSPSCTEVGTDMLFMTSTPDGGDLMGQIPTDGTTSGLVVSLTLPGTSGELGNWGDATAGYEDDVFTFEGVLSENPHASGAEHDLTIELTCP